MTQLHEPGKTARRSWAFSHHRKASPGRGQEAAAARIQSPRGTPRREAKYPAAPSSWWVNLYRHSTNGLPAILELSLEISMSL